MRYKIPLLFFIYFFAGLVFAEKNHLYGVGAVAENLMEPVTIVSNFMGSASLILGVMCLFAAFIRYRQFRVNPLATPISVVIMLIIFGVAFLLLPFVYKLTQSGIPFTIG